MKIGSVTIILILALLAVGEKARAQDSSAVRHHVVSVGFDPLFLSWGLWGKAELRILPTWSIAGHVAAEIDGSRRSFGLLGGDLCWYPSGTFDGGLQLIWHVMYEHDSLFFNPSIRGDPEIPAYSWDVAYGPMLGYKYMMRFGLTADLQFGILRTHEGGSVAVGGVDPGPDGYRYWGYFNIGWSF